jgi:hypothetical protein
MGQHNGNKHMLMMLLCCLAPLAIIFAVTNLGISLGNLGAFAVVLMCPLMHIFMMKGMMGHGSQGQASCHDVKQEVARPLPSKEG